MTNKLVRLVLLMPLYDVFKKQLLTQVVIHAVEIQLKAIREETTGSFMWVYCCGEDKQNNNKIKNIILFDYLNSRSARCPITFLDCYSNYLQVDGYVS